MLNAPINPIVSVSDQVYALLSVMADPHLHKARLDELVEKEKAASARIAELRAMESDILPRHSTAQATTIVADRRLAAAAEREAEVEQKVEQLSRLESTRSDAALRRRENVVEARENAVKAVEERVAVREKDVAAREAKIKNFSSAL